MIKQLIQLWVSVGPVKQTNAILIENGNENIIKIDFTVRKFDRREWVMGKLP